MRLVQALAAANNLAGIEGGLAIAAGQGAAA
jgi:hypothetical protein